MGKRTGRRRLRSQGAERPLWEALGIPAPDASGHLGGGWYTEEGATDAGPDMLVGFTCEDCGTRRLLPLGQVEDLRLSGRLCEHCPKPPPPA